MRRWNGNCVVLIKSLVTFSPPKQTAKSKVKIDKDLTIRRAGMWSAAARKSLSCRRQLWIYGLIRKGSRRQKSYRRCHQRHGRVRVVRDMPLEYVIHMPVVPFIAKNWACWVNRSEVKEVRRATGFKNSGQYVCLQNFWYFRPPPLVCKVPYLCDLYHFRVNPPAEGGRGQNLAKEREVSWIW